MTTLTKSTGTVTLSGAVEKVSLPAVYGWVWVKNMSDGDMFLGLSDGISAGADGVLAIPAGECGRIQTDGQDSVYLMGSGNALVVAQNYADCPFKAGGKGGDITPIVSLTRAEYDNISEKNPDVYYAITDDVGEFVDNIILNVGVDKEYTSFTSAMREAAKITDQKVLINVFAGEYDVYSELGGDDFVLGIGDKKYYEFQPVLSGDVEIRGIGNVILKLEVPDSLYTSNVENCRKISTIHNNRNVLIENITFITKNCRYAIHDECGNDIKAANTTHIVRNCRFYNTNTMCAIGVGCVSPNYKIENCYAENTNGCLFLHDWDVSSGGNLTVSNCIFESETNNEMLLSAHSESTFDVFLTNNNFERLAVNSVDATKYEKNIFRIIGVGNTIPNVTVDDGLTNPYPVKLV